MRYVGVALVAIFATAMGGCALAQTEEAEMTEQEILAGADARIQEHRTAEIRIRVTRAGKPVDGAAVHIEQLRHEFLFGANIFGYWEIPEPERKVYLQRFAELMNFASLPFYWSSYERQQGQTRAGEMRQCAQWCTERGIVPKAHPLIFNTSAGVPKWLSDDPATALKQTHQHIEQTVRQFTGTIDVFDVVNEAIKPWRFENAMTDAWRLAGQAEFAAEALRIARKANPKATLIINDYVLEKPYEELLAGLVDEKGKPLFDVVGIQSHMFAGVWPIEWQWRCCEIYSQFGKPLHFTEVSILSGPITSGPKTQSGRGVTTPAGEAEQADEAERLYTVLFSHPAVEAITWWTFCDRRPWDIPPTGLLRKDMTPKPAYDRLKALIKGKWWTRAAGKTDPAGVWTVRAYFGTHRLQVDAPDGTTRTLDIEVNKAGQTDFQVKLENPAPK